MENKDLKVPTIHEWLKGVSLDDLQMIENGDRVMFPDVIKRITPKGFFDEKVMVQVPRTNDLTKARIETKKKAESLKIDRTLDADIFDEIETIYIVSLACREVGPPHSQAYTAEQLMSSYDIPSIFDIYNKIHHYRKLIDPRITEPSIDDVVTATLGIAEKKSLDPLIAIAGSHQDAFLVEMACLLAKYLMHKPLSPSQTTSSAD